MPRAYCRQAPTVQQPAQPRTEFHRAAVGADAQPRLTPNCPLPPGPWPLAPTSPPRVGMPVRPRYGPAPTRSGGNSQSSAPPPAQPQHRIPGNPAGIGLGRQGKRPLPGAGGSPSAPAAQRDLRGDGGSLWPWRHTAPPASVSPPPCAYLTHPAPPNPANTCQANDPTSPNQGQRADPPGAEGIDLRFPVCAGLT